MKRIISIILIIVAFCSMSILPNAFASSDIKNENELEFLNMLGIINTDVDKPEDLVTREMMALYVARMLNIDENQKVEVRYFTDVEHLGFSATAINALAERGIVSIPENRLFNPGQYITQNEALKMLVCATGYEAYAVANGGWSWGYIRAAEQAGFYSVCENPNAMTIDEVGKMVYEAMCAPMYIKSSAGGTKIEYEADGDKTVLSEYHDIYMSEGTVQSVYGGSIIKNESPLKEGRIVIGDTEYTIGFDAYEKLGSYVDFFYESETDGDDGNVIYMFSEKTKSPEIEIDINLFKGYENETVSYYANAQTKRLSNETMEDPIIIYNGSVLGSGVEATLKNLNKGSITLKDRDDNGDYDLILIEDYKNFVVSGVDIEAGKIYNKLNSNDTIIYDDCDAVIIFDEAGDKVTMDTLVKGQVLSVLYSKDKKYVRAITSKQSVVGVIAEINDGEDRLLVTIGDKEYFVDKTYEDEFKSFCNVGSEYTFMLDHFGNIALVTDELNSSLTYGYILRALYDDSTDEVKLKILTQKGEQIILNCDKNLSIDGKRYKSVALALIESMLMGEDEKIKGQLVRYGTKDEKIIEIDTKEVSESETDTNSMYKIFANERQSYWYNSYNLGRKAILTTSTPVFYIPNDFNAAKEEDFYVGTASAGLRNDHSYTADAYKNSSLNGFADAVVVYYNATSDMGNSGAAKKIFIVDEIKKGLYEDEVVTIVEGFENSSAKTVYVPLDIDMSGIEQGDVLTFTYDIKGNVMKSTENSRGVEVIFDCDKKIPASYSTHWLENNASGHLLYNEGSKTAGNYRSEFQISYGNVVYKKDSIVQWSAKDFGEYTDSGDLSGKVVVIYNELTEKVYTGSVDDIIDYKSAGEDCSKILYVTRGGAGSFAIVYNYK